MFNAFPYLGKGSIKKTERVNQGQFLTIMLMEDCFDTDQTATTDNWFTSLPLAKALEENGLNIVGTMKKKTYLPTVMTDMSKTRPTGTTAFFFSKDSMVIFYKPKSDKVVTLPSTIHHAIGFGEKNKPTALLFTTSIKVWLIPLLMQQPDKTVAYLHLLGDIQHCLHELTSSIIRNVLSKTFQASQGGNT